MKVGSNVAISNGQQFPIIACVTSVPSTLLEQSTIKVQLYRQERTTNKSKWRRGFHLIQTFTDVLVSDIVLYDFEFNAKNKTLKKATLDELVKLI